MGLKHKVWLAVGGVVLGGTAAVGTGAAAYADTGTGTGAGTATGTSPGISTSTSPGTGTAGNAADLVTAVPRAHADRGALTVVPGGAGGPDAAARKALTQSSPGVPGLDEPGDAWAAATALGDLNGDGHPDLVIGAPGEDDTSGHRDRGAVTMLYGPDLTSGTDFQLSEDFAYAKARFGAAVAAGDFNKDGKDDVFAVSTGTGGSWAARFSTGHEAAGTFQSGERAIDHPAATSGDFDHDGYADAALTYRDAAGHGRLVWFKGTRSGLSRVGHLSAKGGRSVAAGDVNGDGYDDLVVGQPYTAESGARAGGQVTVVNGGPGGPAGGATTVHQATPGVPGAAEAGDALGWSVAAADVDGDGCADVLTGAPGEDITRAGETRTDAGTSLLLKGSRSGLTGAGALAVSQDEPDVPGVTETGDRLGSSVALADFDGSGHPDLAVGADGEDRGDGTVLHVGTDQNGTVLRASGTYYGRARLDTPAGAHLGQVLGS
ncbi:FG-GAP and VCBS repeat-containing protein [Streptomyces longispororuber]|uniref:FG-GAP and VCBS repeat-containing protein n=1 Tax=Streptomyces longispororuber TaxID=68230 RepID=UPI003702AD7C